MTDSQLALLGAITGVIGTLTGLVGLGLSIVSFRRSQRIKALDLRLQLRKGLADTRLSAGELPGLLNRARHSRAAVLSALGMSRTGSFEAWKEQWERDLSAATQLGHAVPADAVADTQNHKALEKLLVDLHELTLRVDRLRQKYEGELASDDKDRDRIRVAAEARINRTQ